MNFEEALKSLVEGKYIQRESCTDGAYYVLLPGMQYIWKVMTQPNPAAGNWLPLVDDLQATDWKIVDTNFKTELLEVAA